MGTKTKQIVIVFNSLDIGGIERKIVDLSKHYSIQKDTRLIIVLKHYQGQLLKLIPRSIKVLYPRHSIFFPLWLIRKLFDLKPNLVLTFGNYCGVLSIISKFISFSKYNIVISEDSSVTTQIENDKYPTLRKLLVKLCYPHASSIITLTSAGKDKLVNLVPNTINKVSIIPNWLPLSNQFTTNINKDIDILFIARFEPQKDPLRFLKIVKSLSINSPHLKVVMIGSGSLKTAIVKYVSQNNLAVQIIPATTKVNTYYQRAKVFVMTSVHEGFPLTILESLFNNCPIVCTNMPEVTSFFNYQTNIIINHDNHQFIDNINYLLQHPKTATSIINHYRPLIINAQQHHFHATVSYLNQFL